MNYAMSIPGSMPVHARSLVNVVELADNPPAQYQFSGNGLRELHEWAPLVLYVARVPGSRDIFLTTVKPQDRVVTASDVQSCLYYLHVDSPADVALLRDEDGVDDGVIEGNEGDRPRVGLSDGGHHIRRKPVLPSRPSASTTQTSAASNSLGKSMATSHDRHNVTEPVEKSPENDEHRDYSIAISDNENHSRSLLGPRPMPPYDHASKNALQSVPQRHNVDTRSRAELPCPPPLPRRPHERYTKNLRDNYGPAHDNIQKASSHQGRLMSRGVYQPSMTLIRRYDNAQANVGKIWETVSPGQSIGIDMMAPGYAKFNSTTLEDTNAAQRDGDAASERLEAPSKCYPSQSLVEGSISTFRCHLHTAHTQRPTHNARAESQDSPLTLRPRLRGSLDLRRRSHISSASLDFSQSRPASSTNSLPSTPKGYYFHTPWNGRCDFVTGVAGRSLKCRHVHAGGARGEPTTVSELRFNLPSAKSISPWISKETQPAGDRRSNRMFLFSHHQRQRSSVSDDLGADSTAPDIEAELEDRMDLSLGREHAGGGFGGRQAKLGKLIVEREGLQMLDLVVATNLSLWWRVYDRSM